MRCFLFVRFWWFLGKQIISIMFLALLVLVEILANISALCDSDKAQFNGSCFKVVSTPNPITFLDARKQCVDVGADLVSIHSADENQFVQSVELSLIKTTNHPKLTNITSSFFIGLLLDRPMIYYYSMMIEEWKNIIADAFWTDGTPMNYGNPSASGFIQGTYPWFNGTSKRIVRNETVYLPGEPNNNGSFYANEICVLMLSGDFANGTWADLPCDVKGAIGFVCKKYPNDTKTPMTPSSSLSAPALSILSVLVQIYVLWLIAYKSPKELQDYRFFLCANTLIDALFTFALGILFNPDIWFPHALASAVNGLGRFFGPYGGAISFCLSVSACTCQVVFQSFALLYRFASVMEKKFPRLHLLLNQWKLRATMLIFIALFAPSISMIIVYSLEDPEQIQKYIYTVYDGYTLLSFSNARLADVPVFMLMPFRIQFDILILGGGFLGVQFGCLLLSIHLILYLKRNSKYFVERRTYIIQMQLIISLSIQLCLPFLFVGLPLLGAFVALIFEQMPGKNAVSAGILLFELYALSNPLMVVVFVTAYREHTSKLLGVDWLKRKFRATQEIHPGRQSGEGGQRQIEMALNPMGNRQPESYPTVAWMPK